MNDISNQTNFLRIFEAAIVLPFAKNRANLRKVGRNFERHFEDSSEFSQLNSKRASKFRRLFRKVLEKFEDCFKISIRSACDPKIVTAALLITEMQSANVFLCKFITLTTDSYCCYTALNSLKRF